MLINSSLIDCTSWLYIRILALAQYTHRKFDILVLFSFSDNFGNNRATLRKHVARCNMSMLHGHTLKSATCDNDQRHVIAFRPISMAARISWSYDNWHYWLEWQEQHAVCWNLCHLSAEVLLGRPHKRRKRSEEVPAVKTEVLVMHSQISPYIWLLLTAVCDNKLYVITYLCHIKHNCLQFLDNVGWVSVKDWVMTCWHGCVCSKVQMICHPIISCFIKIQIGLKPINA